MAELRRPEQAYKLRSKFGRDYELTTDDALVAFFRPIDDLVRGEIEAAAPGKGD